MGWRLILGFGFLISLQIVAIAGTENDTYRACFEPIGIKIDEQGKTIQQLRDAWIAALKEESEQVITWLPNLTFHKNKEMAEEFTAKGKDPKYLDFLAQKYAGAMPNVLLRSSNNIELMKGALKKCDITQAEVRDAVQWTIIELENAKTVNKQIEKELSERVRNELGSAILNRFSFDKPGAKLSAVERVQFFITGFVSATITDLRKQKRGNPNGLIPHRQLAPHAPPTPPQPAKGTHQAGS
jgi:hypothetical protein